MDTTKYTTGIRVSELDPPGVLVELFGEFDGRDLEPLKKALDGALNPGSPTIIDLSGVTFLDVRCTRELADRSRLKLRNLSWQVGASFRACDLDRTGSYPGGERLSPTEEKRAGKEPRDTLALAT